ncbi:MAG TPA: hypothetical protein VM513_11110 [Kofleriaceae bacterium]|jgi:hypothetical protein|nr:hypothetical protein [Kofleriaceae bacterium]
MRIGDHLLQRGSVSLDDLARMLGAQHGSGLRLCSLLVTRGVVSFDDASRALGEQLGVAAVLRKHLQHRDPSVASMLPAALARRIVAVPIGKLGDGAVIVCLRDPTRANYGHVARAMPGRFVLAVAPAIVIERLVEDVYAPKPVVDVQIDVEVPPSISADIPIEVDEPVLAPHASEADIDSMFDALIEKPEPAPASAPASPGLPVAVKRVSTPNRAAPRRDALDATIASFVDIDDSDWLFDAAMTYIASRWRAAILFELRGDSAVALRTHGAKQVTLPLAQPSIVRLARDERRLVHEALEGTSAAQASLAAALRDAAHPVAAPVAREGADAVRFVLAVGQPVRDGEEPEDAAFDLGVLAETMGETHARLGD